MDPAPMQFQYVNELHPFGLEYINVQNNTDEQLYSLDLIQLPAVILYQPFKSSNHYNVILHQ